MIVFDLDDLCDDFDPFSELCSLKNRFPKLKVTLFAIPGRCSRELLDLYAGLDWVELAAHGYHHSSMECAIWGHREAADKLSEIAEKMPVSKLFKAPGWVGNPAVAKALKDGGWSLAHHAGHDEWGDDLPPVYVYNDDTFMVTAIHGHTWDSCGNGPSAWEEMFAGVDADADFAFVSEVVR